MTDTAAHGDAVPTRTRETPDKPEGPLFYTLLALLGTAGFFYVNLAAAIVSGFESRLGFSHAEAGNVMSANIWGGSVGALLAVFAVRRWGWRPMLLGLFTILLVIESSSMFVHSYAVMLPLRAVDGLVGGLATGIALSLLARARLPDRAFGALLVFQFVLGGLGSRFLPQIVVEHGTWVLFACTAAMNLLALLTVMFLKMDAADAREERASRRSIGRPATILVGLIVVALFLFQAANMGLFAFIFPLGEDYGLSLKFISQTVGWTTWIGALGAVFVIVAGDRLGRAKPLAIAMVVTIIGIFGFFWSDDPLIFFLANASTAITWSFVVPYLFGMVSALDRSGHMATLAGFMSGAGLATGPLIAGWIVGPGSFEPLIGMMLVFFFIATGAMLAAAPRIDRRDAARGRKAATAGA